MDRIKEVSVDRNGGFRVTCLFALWLLLELVSMSTNKTPLDDFSPPQLS